MLPESEGYDKVLFYFCLQHSFLSTQILAFNLPPHFEPRTIQREK